MIAGQKNELPVEARPPFRLPATWEANLLSAGLLIWTLAVSGILLVLFNFGTAILIGQMLVLLPVLAWVVVRGLPLRETFRLRPVGAGTAVESVLIGLACWPVVSAAATLLEKPLNWIGPYPANPLPAGWLESAAYAVTFVVIAPLTEEPIYRGFVLRAGLRRGAWAGIALSGFLFGLIHAQIAALLPITALGILFGFLSHRSGSIYNTILAHASYNLVPTILYISPSLRDFPEGVVYFAALAAVPVLAVLVWIFLRGHRRPPVENPPRETSSPVWTILTLGIAVGLFGMMALVEVLLRLFPNGPGG